MNVIEPLNVCVGAPVMAPDGVRTRFAGSAPVVIDQVIGPLPPVAVSWAEYGLSTEPIGNDVVVIAIGGITTIDAEALLLQIPAVALTERRAGETLSTVKVTDVVPWPPVIEPLVIDQLYVAPTPALATEAMLPAEPALTLPGAVMVAFGFGLTLTVVMADAALLQPLAVTMTV